MIIGPIFPISIIGDSSTGKTSLILQYTTSEFSENMSTTLGIDYFMKDVKCYNGKEYKIKIMDTAGQEQYHSMALHMLKLCKGILLVYSITDKKSFENLESNWIKEINEFIDIKNIPIILIGNKKDLDKEREIEEKIGREFAGKYKLKFFETSSKTGENVNLAFQELINDVIKINVEKIDIKEKDKNDNNNKDNSDINSNQTYKLNKNSLNNNKDHKTKKKCC
jgi:small GTP-binding protein